uniref:Uncharacterized protein n=1 Tax=Arundo donax TaxID=35708 RepID=A0A0A8XT19_ARUDO
MDPKGFSFQGFAMHKSVCSDGSDSDEDDGTLNADAADAADIHISDSDSCDMSILFLTLCDMWSIYLAF